MIERLTLGGIVAGAALLVAALAASPASAQYPPPSGVCVATSSVTATAPGGSTTLTITVRDANGNPVAGANVTLTIAKQPGNSASVNPASGTTDANGQFKSTLNVGTTPGTVEVRVDCGDTEGSVSVVAGQPAEPLAPPATGFGPSADRAAAQAAAALGLLGALLLAASGLVLRRETGS